MKRFFSIILSMLLLATSCVENLVSEQQQDDYSIVVCDSNGEPLTLTKSGITEKSFLVSDKGGNLTATLKRNGKKEENNITWHWTPASSAAQGSGDIFSSTDGEYYSSITPKTKGWRQITVSADHNGKTNVASHTVMIKVGPVMRVSNIPDLVQKGFKYCGNNSTSPTNTNSTYTYNSEADFKVEYMDNAETGYVDVTSICNITGLNGAVTIGNGKITANTLATPGNYTLNCTYDGISVSKSFDMKARSGSLTLSKTGFNAEGDEVLVDYSEINTEGLWIGVPSWMHVNGGPFVGNGKFTITVDRNDDSRREGFVAAYIVKGISDPASGEALCRVAVSQDVYTPVSTISLSTLEVNLAGMQNASGTVQVTGLKTNQPWSASVTQGSSWLSVSPSSGTGNSTVTISATSQNNTGSPREGYVSFSNEGGSVSLYVTQDIYSEPLSVSVSADTHAGAGPTEGNTVVTFKVKNNHSHEVTVSNVSYSAVYHKWGESDGTMNLGTDFNKTTYSAGEEVTVMRGHSQVNGGSFTFSYKYGNQTYTKTVTW